MEINDLSNKTDKLAGDFHKSLEELTKFIIGGLDMAKELETGLLSSMTKEQRAKHKTFMIKYNSLMESGKIEEAIKLKEKYFNE